MSFAVILGAHIERYPDMQIQDVYKLMHQAAMGSEHAVESQEYARAWMFRELSEMGVGQMEPVIDRISDDIVRIHLRPFVAGGGDVEALLTAFIRTANEYRGNFELLESYWENSSHLLSYSASEVNAFIKIKRAEGFPAVHHSAVFENNYRPAYRVIWKAFLPSGL